MSGRIVTRLRTSILVLILVLAFGVVVVNHQSIFAASGACTAPSTDYGTVTSTVNITGTGTYRIWTRMSAPDTTNNTYMLEIDGSSCYAIGGSSVPTYANGAVTFFTNNTTNWISKTTTGSQVDVAFSTTGNHTFKLIGNAAGVVVDRLVLTQDLNCTPTGTGDNCANPDVTPPTVSLTAPTDGATNVSTTPTLTANATDTVGVQKVEFYVDGSLLGTDTTASYSYALTAGQALSTGSHTAYAIATDTSGNTTQSTSVSFSVGDTTPPTISSVTATSITQTSATITWTTNEGATSQVKYGATSSYGSQTTTDSSKVTSHSVTISGLTANTTYHYQALSNDASGNAAQSADKTFTTLAPASDTTAPTVSLTAPAASSKVGGKSVTVSATATDNVGVAGVQFKVDGANIGSEATSGSSTFSKSWDTTSLSNGTHTLTAIARDAAGNTKTSASVTVTVNNLSADINQDGSVGYLDLSILASNYNKSGSAITNARADINSDGIVNYLDLSALASKYNQ